MFQLFPNQIDNLLKTQNRFVCWRARPANDKGKFPKIPTDPVMQIPVDGTDPSNWMNWETAIDHYNQGLCDGVGIALSKEPFILVDDEPLFLVALDFDSCVHRMDEIKVIRKSLANTYFEISPSGRGVRGFALSRVPIKGGNDGKGNELYSFGRFVTITGNNSVGQIREATEAVIELEKNWFPPKVQKQCKTKTSDPITPRQFAVLCEMLNYISADCSYEVYRSVVWSILSSAHPDSEKLALEWSQTAPERFEQPCFDTLVSSFDAYHESAPTLGTIYHLARAGGCNV